VDCPSVWPKGASLDLFFCASLTPTNVRGVASPCSRCRCRRRRRRRRRQVNIIIQYTLYIYMYMYMCTSFLYVYIYIYVVYRGSKKRQKKTACLMRNRDGVPPGGERSSFRHTTTVVWPRLARGFSYSHKTLFITF